MVSGQWLVASADRAGAGTIIWSAATCRRFGPARVRFFAATFRPSRGFLYSPAVVQGGKRRQVAALQIAPDAAFSNHWPLTTSVPTTPPIAST